jgi:formyltetrahydrofolate-dependent phosphoribosylglycinamide formyltransferase
MTERLAVFISGSGTNLQALIDAVRHRMLDAEIVVVVSNRADAYGLERAAKAGIPTEYFPLSPYLDDGRGRRAYDADLAELVLDYEPDWVVMAGWMHILSSDFLDEFSYRVINLHPALPGQFPGAHAIQEAFDAFQRGEIKETGVMVHLVPDEQVDAGPVIASKVVPIYRSDTLEVLTGRIHSAEHQLLVQALQRLAEGDE